MAEIVIREDVWQSFVAVAKDLRRQPRRLAEKVLKDYAEILAREKLLAETERAAQRASFDIEDTEEIIREYRRRKAARLKNGHP